MIFILGIDALDYELVEKLNLNNLKQLEHSKIVVPINDEIGVPNSPEVWASFLIGEHMPTNFVSSSPYVTTIKNITELLHIDLDKGFAKKIKDFFRAKYDFSSPIRFGSLNRETFLDITKSYKINVPFYNFDNKTFDIMYLFGKNKVSLTQSIKEIKLIYENRKKQILNEIENINNSETVFAFIHTTDSLQHLLPFNMFDIERNYIDLDNYVSLLKRKLAESFGDFIFIIISDHGFDFERGTHSMKGFHSSNVNLIPKPKNIIDFYGIILELVEKNNELSRL